MENKFRNELEIKLGSETILLRPTFENVQAMEANVGGVAYLGWKFSRGLRLGADGKIDMNSVGSEASIKALPTLTESAKIIYFNQAHSNPNDATKKKFSLEEIWELVLVEGSVVTRFISNYLALIVAGDKINITKDPTDLEKKS